MLHPSWIVYTRQRGPNMDRKDIVLGAVELLVMFSCSDLLEVVL
jgi:hypothetical protein